MDKKVSKCPPQANCSPGYSDTQCINKNLVCNKASPGYYLQKGVVFSCNQQLNCYQYKNDTPCVGNNKDIKPCAVPTPSSKYEINDVGIVVGKSCKNVQSPPQHSTSPERRAWGIGNCLNTLSSESTCKPQCKKGYTINGSTKCQLGILTHAKCKSNDCDGKENSVGKPQKKPNMNPYATKSPEHIAWGKGNCNATLAPNATCKPTCTAGYTVSGITKCKYGGTLDTAKCIPESCKKHTPISMNSPERINLELQNKLDSGEFVDIKCNRKDATASYFKSPSPSVGKYNGNIKLTCNKGKLTVLNECKLSNCSQSQSKICSSPPSTSCTINLGKVKCKCPPKSFGDGLVAGSKCTLCSDFKATEIDKCSEYTIKNCSDDIQCQVSASKCKIKPTYLPFRLSNTCICGSGFYKYSDNECKACATQKYCQKYSNSKSCVKNNEGKYVKYCSSVQNQNYFLSTGLVKGNTCNISVPKNGSIGNCPNDKILKVGATCEPSCNKGYKIDKITECKRNGNIFQVVNTNCLESECMTPVPPTNGQIGGCSPKPMNSQATCAPQCNRGYDLIGISKCVKGNFTSAVCTPGKCASVTKPPHGSLGDCQNTLESGKSCTQTCNTGYYPSPSRAKCDKGKFIPIKCIPNECKVSPLPTGLIKSSQFPSNKQTDTASQYKTYTSLDDKYYLACQNNNCDYKVSCVQNNKDFSVSPSPIRCSLQPHCDYHSNKCNKSTRKIECIEQFTGVIEGFKPQDHKCSIKNYNICKIYSKTDCYKSENCVWDPTSSPKCQIKQGDTKCKNFKIIANCKPTPECKWHDNDHVRGSNFVRGGCKDHYHIESPNRVCKLNTCKCQYGGKDVGTPRQNKCNIHNDNQCIQCKPGYRLVKFDKVYAENALTTPKHWVGTSNPSPSKIMGLTTQTSGDCQNFKCLCVPNICTCPSNVGSTPQYGDKLDTNNVTLCYENKKMSCKSCKKDYEHYNERGCFKLCKSSKYIESLPKYDKNTGKSISEKVCSPLTTCGTNEYELVIPRKNSDNEYINNRKCKKLTDHCCKGKKNFDCKKYEASPPIKDKNGNGYKTDRICKPLQTCKGKDEYLSKKAIWRPTPAPGVYITNNECKKFKVCKKDENTIKQPQKKFPEQTFISERVCKKLTECPPGQFVIKVPMNDEDRKCSKCPPNTFSIKKNSMSCTSMENCGLGLRTNTKGSSTKNRTCQVCPSGKTSDKTHNEKCLLDAPPTKCFCNHGAPVGNCKQKTHNCKNCSSGYIMKKIGSVHRCVDAQLSQYCNNGVIKGDIKKGNAECLCIRDHYGGGPWNGNGFEKCVKKLNCTCSNGVSATNIPCGSGKRPCPLINSKGNLDKNGKPVSISCPESGKNFCESCDKGFSLNENKECIKDCPNNHWWDGKICKPHTICSKDQYEYQSASKKYDRQCVMITKKCPKGETIVRGHTKTTDTVCSGLQTQVQFMTKKQSKGNLQKCSPKDNREITYNLCHLNNVKNLNVIIPNLNKNYQHYVLSVFSDNMEISSMSSMMKQNFILVIKQILYKKLSLTNKKDVILLSIKGNNPLRIDIAVKDPQETLLPYLAKKKIPLFIFKIVDIQKTSKIYITGIRKL